MQRLRLTIFLIAMSLPVFAQNLGVKVFNQTTKASLSGVNIKLEGSASYTFASDDNGLFLKELSPGRYSLKASRVGYENYTILLELKPGQFLDIQIPLVETINSLSEIEVISASRRNTSSLKLPFASSIISRPSQSENIPRSTP